MHQRSSLLKEYLQSIELRKHKLLMLLNSYLMMGDIPIIFPLNTIKTQKYFMYNVYKWSVAKMATTTTLLIFLLQKLFAQDICQCWLSVGQHLMFMNYGPTICQMQKCIFCANGHIRMDQSSRKCLKQSEMQTNG